MQIKMSGVFISRFSFISGLLLMVLLSSCATTDLHSTPSVQSYQGSKGELSSIDPSRLKVMTLNIAHGRGTSFHQMLQYSDETKKNLDDIAMLLTNTEADVVALQEADRASFWSGNFNHVEYLARHSAFAYSIQASHVDALGLSYGTALISRLNLTNPQAITFAPSLSPVAKGFVVSTISWPGRADIEVDVVSVHLDFMSESVRKKQSDELIAILRASKNRIIVMGDLNTEWKKKNSAVQYLAENLGLSVYQSDNKGLITFPSLGVRIDWVLISTGLKFYSHEIIGTELSDHRGVVAELVVSNR